MNADLLELSILRIPQSFEIFRDKEISTTQKFDNYLSRENSSRQESTVVLSALKYSNILKIIKENLKWSYGMAGHFKKTFS